MSSTDLSSIARLLSSDDSQQLSSSLPYFEEILSDHAVYHGADEQVIHKFKVRISSLLKSKSAAARSVGCKIAQTSCSQNWDILLSHGSTWSQLLLHIIQTPGANPVSTQQAAIRALQTIISLTHGKTDLTRTIATPIIPHYLKALLSASSKTPALSNEIILSINTVLSEHSTTARPHAGPYHEFLLKIFQAAADGGLSSVPADLVLAARGFVSLHKAAVKGNEALEWKSALSGIVNDLKIQVDLAYGVSLFPDSKGTGTGLSQQSNDLIKNLHRLSVLFIILNEFFTTSTKTAVPIPLTSLVNLFRTLLSPNTDFSSSFGYDIVVRNNSIKCIYSLVDSVGPSFLSYADDILFDLASLIKNAKNDHLRSQAIELSTTLLTCVLKKVPKSVYDPISTITLAALALINMPEYATTSKAPDYTQKPHLFARERDETTIAIVNKYLEAVVIAFPDLALPIRAKIDFHFLMTTYAPGLEASTLYPGCSTKYSILPMAISLIPESLVLSALTHPRLPLTQAAAYHDNTQSFYKSSGSSGKTTEDVEMDDSVNNGVINGATEWKSREWKQHEESVSSQMEVSLTEAPDPIPLVMEKVQIKTNLDFELNQTLSPPHLIRKPTNEAVEDDDDELGSDIEIPEIELGESDDE